VKKSVFLLTGLVLLAGCGAESERANQMSEQPIATSESPIASPTVSTSSKHKVEKIEIVKGVVASCANVRFHQEPVEDLIINCLDGAQGFNLAAIKGPAIVNVWGSWCPPCVGEVPIFVEFYSRMDSTIQLVGVDYQDGPLFAVKPFIEKIGMRWPNFVDPDGLVSVISGKSVPVTWFVNSSNEIVYKKFGPVTSLKELQSLSQKYLGVS